ncbi:antitoxin Xre/MbcA/ParS toxin-binding domain-containing protein [Rhodoferax sp.]|uniref:antitoxin Xre/MbcA/ParS toxin-binding domain-containing protein n=1 Tax=Rhodoferax sp. TaxID=50421 RepID=UPI0025D7021D|nr:antitoxin Xre/MbcA/ParS toxin-binding domain-containing protein [Rhodoferax sp.]
MQPFAMPSPMPFAPYFASRDCRAPVALGVDMQFIALLDAYRPSGGLARTQETLELFMRRGGPDLATVARWMAGREVLCLDWHAQSWMPVFQFDLVDMVPLPQLALVLAELNPVYPPWALAAWFAQPNPWLEGERPADVLVSDAADVLNAARADRFVAQG